MKRNLLAACVTFGLAGPLMATTALAQSASFPWGDVQQTINLQNAAGTTTYVNEGAYIGGMDPSASTPYITNQVGTVFFCADIADVLNTNSYSDHGQLSSSYMAPDSSITLGSNLNTYSNLAKLIYNGETIVSASSGSTQANLSAGLQIAIWALLYNSSSSGWTAAELAQPLTTNVPFQVNVTSTTSDIVNAAAFLACLAAPTGSSFCSTAWGSTTDNIEEVTQSGGQNLIILTNGGVGNNQAPPVPEPASMAILGAGLAGLFVARKRRGG